MQDPANEHPTISLFQAVECIREREGAAVSDPAPAPSFPSRHFGKGRAGPGDRDHWSTSFSERAGYPTPKLRLAPTTTVVLPVESLIVSSS